MPNDPHMIDHVAAAEECIAAAQQAGGTDPELEAAQLRYAQVHAILAQAAALNRLTHPCGASREAG